MEPWIFILFAAVIILIVVGANYSAKRRREEMFRLAAELGLQFEPHPGDVHGQFSGFSPFEQGSSRVSSNYLHGPIGELNWDIFDYKYQTGSGDDRTTHHYGIVAARSSIVLPRLTMRPEGFFDKIASLVGFDDINFESDEFSRRYHVKCDNRKACFDLIHPQMIEYLLKTEARDWQIRGTRIMLTRSGSSKPDQIKRDIELIQGFYKLIPDYLRQERTIGA